MPTEKISYSEWEKKMHEERIQRYIKISGDEKFHEAFAKELLMAEKIYRKIAEQGRVPGMYWQFFHDSYVDGRKLITLDKIDTVRPLAMDIYKTRESVTHYLKKGIQALCDSLCENPIKDKDGCTLNLEQIHEKYPDITRMLAYGVCIRYKKYPSILRSRYRYNEYGEILSFFQVDKFLKTIDSEVYKYLLFTYSKNELREINDIHLKKMAFDRSYVISLLQWR